MKTYAVKELFGPTIQGEGKGSGEVVFFLRFAGCNKWTGRPEDKASSACPFCDTDFVGGEKLTASQIILELETLRLGCPSSIIVISGGEPALQIDHELIAKLKEYGWTIYVETNGSREIPQAALDLIDHISCSPKQSAADTKIQRIDSIKILHPAERPERDIRHFLDDCFKLQKRIADVYIQPVMDENYSQNLQDTLKICYTYAKVRLSLQLHKTIEVR